jgi:hypothetical protein
MNKKECIKAMPPHTQSAQLTPPKQENSVNGLQERNDKKKQRVATYAGCVSAFWHQLT